MLFKLKHASLKIAMDLQIALAAEAHPTDGQREEAQRNREKSRVFRAGIRVLTLSKTEGQNLAPL
jgi:hypothetical protein